MNLEYEVFNGTPIFVARNNNFDYHRVHGAAFDRDRQCWLFPAYPPFAEIVIDDLRKVDPNLTLSNEVQNQLTQLAQIPELIAKKVLPDGFTFHTKPFDHQITGFLTLRHNPRFALLWDMGVGKTKPVIDLLRSLPNQRALVLAPKSVVLNWLEQIRIHGPDLKAAAIFGTLAHKREVISRYKDYNVLITSYGTARNMGLPRLHKETLAAILEARNAGRKISDAGIKDLARVIRIVGDKERQFAYVFAWGMGSSVADIEAWAAAEAKLTPQCLCDIDYSIMIADESQNLIDITSQQTKTVLHLGRQASRRYIMSGTPSLGDPRHLYPQMQFLSPAIFPENWFTFGDKFLIRSKYNKRIVTGFKNLNILNERVQRIATRLKKEECLDLPERTIIDRTFALSVEQQRLYNTLIQAMGADLTQFFDHPTGSLMEVQNAAVLLNKLSQISSGFLFDSMARADACDGCKHVQDCVAADIQPFTSNCKVMPVAPENKINYTRENPKLELLEELLDGILDEPDRKVIIWTYYKPSSLTVETLLTRRKINYVVGGGNRSQERVNEFNNNPAVRVYLAQIATGVGITLNAATYMIYYELDWSLGTYLQSIDRNYRVGQEKKVIVYRLLGLGTCDLYKAKVLDEKKDISTLLTNRLACVTCLKHFDCLANHIELFDPPCIYQRSARRTVAKAKEIMP